MAWDPPSGIQNPATGDAILAAWGDGVNTALDFLATNFPHCTVYNNTVQSVNNDTLTVLTANSETSDIGGMHSTVSQTSRITIPAGLGGLYVCSTTVSFDPDADGYRLVRFLVNNLTDYPVQQINTNTAGSQGTTTNGARRIILAAGDYIEVQIRHTAGSALDVTLRDFSVEWRATT